MPIRLPDFRIGRFSADVQHFIITFTRLDPGQKKQQKTRNYVYAIHGSSILLEFIKQPVDKFKQEYCNICSVKYQNIIRVRHVTLHEHHKQE